MLRVFEPIKYRLNRGWLHHIAFFIIISYIHPHIRTFPIWYYCTHVYTLLRWKNQFESYNPMIVNYRLIEFQRERERKIFKSCSFYGRFMENFNLNNLCKEMSRKVKKIN